METNGLRKEIQELKLTQAILTPPKHQSLMGKEYMYIMV